MNLIDTLTTAYSATTISFDVDSDDLAVKYIIATAISTSLGLDVEVNVPNKITIELAPSYIDSLTTTELELFDSLLAEKEQVLLVSNQEVSDKQKVITQDSNKVYQKVKNKQIY